MASHDTFITWLKSEFQQIYVFSVIAILLGMVLLLLAHGDFKPEVDTLLNVIATGLITQMGAIVTSLYNANKARTQSARVGDGSAAPDQGTNGGAPQTGGPPIPQPA